MSLDALPPCLYHSFDCVDNLRIVKYLVYQHYHFQKSMILTQYYLKVQLIATVIWSIHIESISQ